MTGTPSKILLLKWLLGYRAAIAKIYAMAALQGLMYLAIPLVIQAVITYIMAGRFTASLIALCCITVTALSLIGYFQLWQHRINETLHQKIFADLTVRMSKMVQYTPSSPGAVQKVNKFMESAMLQKGIRKILMDFSLSVVSIVFGLILLPMYSTWFLIFTVLLSIAFVFIVLRFGMKGIDSSIRTSDVKYRMLAFLQNLAFDKNSAPADMSAELLDEYFTERTAHYRILEKQYKGVIIFKILFIAILLFFGAYLVQAGELNIGQFVASEIIVFLVINAVEKLVQSVHSFYEINTSLYKVESVFNDHPELTFTGVSAQEQHFCKAYSRNYGRLLKTSVILLLAVFAFIMFLPWTQTVRASGQVTVLNPENRPQTITSRIAGRIEKWYINEGDYVKQHDTILFISEIKDEYVDPLLIQRSENQIRAKETTLVAYENKINAANAQIGALNQSLRLKTEQARNKLVQARIRLSADSIESRAAANNLLVAEEQFKRYEKLFGKGVISKTDLENRNVRVQDALAAKARAENKYIADRNELLNIEIELNSIQQEFQEKLMKAESEKFSALSQLYDGMGTLTKLQNQLANYSMRQRFYFVLAPQDGFIARTYYQGIGEIVKEGSSLCTIVPDSEEKAVELYIDPVDLPLISKGQSVQLIFDGWPAFVFSGWPGASVGTFSAEVVAFDRVVSENGKFRLLAKSGDAAWPEAVQIGGGVRGFALLHDVPVIYELWRIINGFPPEFYKQNGRSGK